MTRYIDTKRFNGGETGTQIRAGSYESACEGLYRSDHAKSPPFESHWQRYPATNRSEKECATP
jgi:hypothetical protein